MSVAGAKAAVLEMLESTWEHEISDEGELLCHLPDIVLGNLKHSCVCSELKKEGTRCFLVCPKTTVACCLFPTIKL